MTRQYMEQLPSHLGLEDLDTTVAPGTKYTSGLIDVRGAFAFQAIVDTTAQPGGASGAASLAVHIYALDKVTRLATVTLVTQINTRTDGQQCLLVFGAGNAAVVATDTGKAGTLGPDADAIKVIGFLALEIEITQASDATSSSVSVTLLSERG